MHKTSSAVSPARGLRFRFITLIAAVLICATLVLSLVIGTRELKVMERLLEAEGRSVAALVARVSQDPLVARDTIQLDAIAHEAKYHREVLFATISDAAGELMTSRFASINVPDPRVAPLLKRLPREAGLREILAAITAAEPMLVISAPVRIFDRSVGTVTLGLSKRAIREQVAWTMFSVFGLNMAAAAVLGLFLYVFTQRAILSPVTRLADAAASFGRGEFDHRVTADGRDELGVLAAAFNGMADDIATLLRERDAARRSLEEANEALEARVQQRTNELAAANRELEAFSYSVSHDLRAPLRGIDGFSLALLEDYGDRLDEGARDHLGRIRRGCVRMGALIDDMLQLARLTRSVMRHEPVDLSDIVAGVASDLRLADPARDVSFVIEPALVASGDPSLLRVALTNLVGNAWKFTRNRPGARVEFGARREGDRTAYYVRDNGAGFDMRYADKLFTAFQRLHTEEEFEGTGIGLAIVQRIVQRHGGRIHAEGAPGAGATFHFTLGEDAA